MAGIDLADGAGGQAGLHQVREPGEELADADGDGGRAVGERRLRFGKGETVVTGAGRSRSFDGGARPVRCHQPQAPDYYKAKLASLPQLYRVTIGVHPC